MRFTIEGSFERSRTFGDVQINGDLFIIGGDSDGRKYCEFNRRHGGIKQRKGDPVGRWNYHVHRKGRPAATRPNPFGEDDIVAALRVHC